MPLRGRVCPAGRKLILCSHFGRLRGGGREKRDVVFARMIRALRAQKLFFALYLGRLRGGRQGGAGYGASPPSRPPLHPPRSTPLRISKTLFLRGLRGLCCGSFLASLGDLPPRRAMPSCAFALRGSCEGVCLLKNIHNANRLEHFSFGKV